MKTLIIRALQRRAKKAVTQFHPTVVAVTGSIGKTSTRQTIAVALEDVFPLRTPLKNYNNEFGLPLAILGEKSPGKNAWEWGKLLWRTRTVRDFPKLLVLEYGADKAGDISALCAVAQPNIAVITGISPVHAANYTDLDALIDEKASLGELTDPNGLVVLNAADPRVLAMKERMKAPVVTYGFNEADVCASDIQIHPRFDVSFEPGEVYVTTTAVVRVGGDEAMLELTNCIGKSPVLSCLAAIAVARHLGVSLQAAVKQLNAKVRPVPGRLNPLAGIRGSLVIDDTYNAAPASVRAGLEALAMFRPGERRDRRIVALGKMAELGKYARDEHAAIGRDVARVADLFVAVGHEMSDAVEAAREAGMRPDQVRWLEAPVQAGRLLDEEVRAGDIVFVKGSQSARMEKAVKDIMAEPQQAAELLVRQEPYWLKR